MRTAATILLACLLGVLGLGCGSQDDSTPVACLEGPEAFLTALEAAPGEVQLDGDTAIGDCLAQNQKAGDLANVGSAMVEAATQLNAAAREDPSGQAAVQLGFLIGAAERGAQDTEGIHSDLIRRLTVAARFAPDADPLSAQFKAAYVKGFDAGKDHG